MPLDSSPNMTATAAPINGADGRAATTSERALLLDLLGRLPLPRLRDMVSVDARAVTVTITLDLVALTLADATTFAAVAGGSAIPDPRRRPTVFQPAEPEPPKRCELLSPRQMEVMRAIRDGKSNKSIAAQLGTSEGTIKIHNTAIFKRLKATSRTHAVRRAQELGVV